MVASRTGCRDAGTANSTMRSTSRRSPRSATRTHPGRAFFDRKVAEGKTKREAVRALKRRISDAIYRQLLHRRHGDTGPGGQAGTALQSSVTGLTPQHRRFGRTTPGPDPTLEPANRSQPRRSAPDADHHANEILTTKRKSLRARGVRCAAGRREPGPGRLLRVSSDARSLLLDLLRQHVCANAHIAGQDVVAEGQGHVSGKRHTISLLITASAIEESLRHHSDPQAAAGELLTDVEEELHFAALESDDPLTIVIS